MGRSLNVGECGARGEPEELRIDAVLL
jgi:hypothetical protein